MFIGNIRGLLLVLWIGWICSCQPQVRQALPVAYTDMRPVSNTEMTAIVNTPTFERPEANLLMQRFVVQYNQIKDEVQGLIAQENSLIQLLTPKEKEEFKKYIRSLDLPE